MRSYLIGTLILAFSCGAVASDASLTDGRANVMECSHEEIVAYMDLPDPGRQVLKDYDAWQAAYISTEVKKSEDDPGSCIGLIYGDLGAMAENIKNATAGLASISLMDMASQLGDMLLESVCDRVEATTSEVNDAIIAGVENVRSDAIGELEDRYGTSAMESKVTDAVVPPDFKAQGVKYRNGEISTGRFRSNVRSRWLKELDELKD